MSAIKTPAQGKLGAVPIKMAPMSLEYSEADLQQVLSIYGKVRAVFFAKDAAGERIIVDRISPDASLFGPMKSMGHGIYSYSVDTSKPKQPEQPVGHKFGIAYVLMTNRHDTVLARGMMDNDIFGDSTIHANEVTDNDWECVLRSAPDGLLKEKGGKLVVVADSGWIDRIGDKISKLVR